MIAEELHGSWDQPTRTICMHDVKASRVQVRSAGSRCHSVRVACGVFPSTAAPAACDRFRLLVFACITLADVLLPSPGPG